MNTPTIFNQILLQLMSRYQDRVPDVKKIITAMIQQEVISTEEEIINDHIAFRTMGVQHLGIQSLEKIFLAHGYKKRDYYRFDQKKLNAYWYAPPSPELNWPRIFISELCIHELSPQSQKIIQSYTNTITTDPVDQLNLQNANDVGTFLHSPLWQCPTWSDYQHLLNESEYAAWVIYNRYYLNHFTISVHHLPVQYNTIAQFNRFLERIGITLNDSGGKVKTSPDGNLIQSATVAQQLPATFTTTDGQVETHPIAGSYVEFAERRHEREGFEAQNADKIFESTYQSQIKKQHP